MLTVQKRKNSVHAIVSLRKIGELEQGQRSADKIDWLTLT